MPGPEPFRKKEVVEILSHKKAYNTCEGLRRPRGWGGAQDTTPWGHRASDSPQWIVEIGPWGPPAPATGLCEGSLPGSGAGLGSAPIL